MAWFFELLSPWRVNIYEGKITEDGVELGDHIKLLTEKYSKLMLENSIQPAISIWEKKGYKLPFIVTQHSLEDGFRPIPSNLCDGKTKSKDEIHPIPRQAKTDKKVMAIIRSPDDVEDVPASTNISYKANDKKNFDMDEYAEYIIEHEKDEDVRMALIQLGEFARINAYQVKVSKYRGNYQYIVLTRNGTAMLYSWDTDSVHLRLGNFPKDDFFTSKRNNLVNSLTQLGKGFEYINRLKENRDAVVQSFSIGDTIVDHGIMKAFQKAVMEFQKGI